MLSSALERVLAFAGALAVVALAVLVMFAWADYRDSGVDDLVAERSSTPEKTTPSSASVVEEPEPRSSGVADVARLRLTASRGDCWILARLNSPQGQVLYQRVLSRGQSIRLVGKRLYLVFGAPANLTATLNGAREGGLPQTGPVFVTSLGIRSLTETGG